MTPFSLTATDTYIKRYDQTEPFFDSQLNANLDMTVSSPLSLLNFIYDRRQCVGHSLYRGRQTVTSPLTATI